MSEYYNVISNNSKVRTDRYKNCSILKDKETGDVLLSSLEYDEIPRSLADRYHRVASNETTRLDIIAHKYYKNPLLWWVIAQANDIYNPLEKIPPGTLLRIPDISTLYGNYGILL